MPYVQRDETGKVNGVARWFTEGVAEEFLEDDDPQVVAYLSPSPSVPSSISRRQFFQQAALNGIISQDEALAAVTTGALPASIAGFIGTLPSDQQFGAKMLFSVNDFARSSPMANAFGQTLDMTPEEIDAFFMAAWTL